MAINNNIMDDWATETTLIRIREILDGSVDKGPLNELIKIIALSHKGSNLDQNHIKSVLQSVKQSAKQNKDSGKKADRKMDQDFDFYRSMLKNQKDIANKFNKDNIKYQISNVGEIFVRTGVSAEEAFEKVNGLIVASAENVFIGTNKILKHFSLMGETAQKMFGTLRTVSIGLLTVSGAITGYLMGAITTLSDHFYTLYDSGVNFAAGLSKGESGMSKILSAAVNANLSLEDFTEFMANNTAVALRIGSNNLINLSHAVRKTMYETSNFGLTIADTHEYLGDLLELQKIAGTIDILTDHEKEKATMKYVRQLNLLSNISGKRRKEISEEIKQQQKNHTLMAYTHSLTEEQRKIQEPAIRALNGFLRQLEPSGKLVEDFSNSIQFNNFSATESYRYMVAAGREVEADYLQTMQNRIKSGNIHEDQVFGHFKSLVDMANSNLDSARLLGEGLGQAYPEIGAFIAPLNEMFLQMAKTVPNATDEIKGLEKGMRKWEEIQNKFRNIWLTFIADLLNNEHFMNTIEKILENFQKLFSPFDENGKMSSAIKIMQGAATGVATVFQWFTDGNVITKLALFTLTLSGAIIGLKALWALITLKPLMKLGKSVMDNYTGSGSTKTSSSTRNVGRAGRATGKPVGRWGKGTAGMAIGQNVGGFFGGLAKGTLSGIAQGLKAFKSPQILLGAGILAGSIAVISLGLAAASAIIGVSLKPLVSSIEKFSQIDGDNLKKVGIGIQELGTGLSYLALGGINNAISSLLNIFSKSPIEKLRELAEIGPGLNQTSSSMKMLVSEMKMLSDIVSKKEFNDSIKNMVNIPNSFNALRNITQTGGLFGQTVNLKRLNEITDALSKFNTEAAGIQPNNSDYEIKNLLTDINKNIKMQTSILQYEARKNTRATTDSSQYIS